MITTFLLVLISLPLFSNLNRNRSRLSLILNMRKKDARLLRVLISTVPIESAKRNLSNVEISLRTYICDRVIIYIYIYPFIIANFVKIIKISMNASFLR